jgi:hypothetical protein
VPSSRYSVEFVDGDSDHQVIRDDAAAHSTLIEKGETTEHLSLGEICPIGQRSADAIREVFVVRHQDWDLTYKASDVCLLMATAELQKRK